MIAAAAIIITVSGLLLFLRGPILFVRVMRRPQHKLVESPPRLDARTVGCRMPDAEYSFWAELWRQLIIDDSCYGPRRRRFRRVECFVSSFLPLAAVIIVSSVELPECGGNSGHFCVTDDNGAPKAATCNRKPNYLFVVVAQMWRLLLAVRYLYRIYMLLV